MSKIYWYGIILLLAIIAPKQKVHAQRAVIKTNVLYAISSTPNLSVEYAYNEKQSIDVQFGYNAWDLKNSKKVRHWLLRPEWRWWQCDKFNGFFGGIHLQGGEYNFSQVKMPFNLFKSLRNNRYEGFYYGGGVSVGYHWVASNRFAVESSIGVGYNRFHYDKYSCDECSPILKTGIYNYFGLTRLSVSAVYYIR